MSSDNYYAIRLHPLGGFTALSSSASDDRWRVVDSTDPRFETLDEAMEYGNSHYSEYGVNVHPECYHDNRRKFTQASVENWALEDEITLYQNLVRAMYYDLMDQLKWDFAFDRKEFGERLALLLEETVGNSPFEKQEHMRG